MKKLGDWFAFPFVFKPNVAAIDKAMRGFAAGASWFFEDIVGQGLIRLVNSIQWGLATHPVVSLGGAGFLPWVEGPGKT